MQAELFNRFCALVHEKAGIHLKPGKEALLSARIARRQRALCLDDPAAYLAYLEADTHGREMVQFLDAVSTNYTSFFREADHLKELTDFAAGRSSGVDTPALRVWSAACSSGEEPYSMAIALLDEQPGRTRAINVRILATDISTHVLEEARSGVYPASRLTPLAPRVREHYFDPAGVDPRHGEAQWRVSETLSSMISFCRLNLAHPPFPMKGPFDAVFCRNVLIYFDQPTRQRLISEIERLMAPGALLCIGHTETLTGVRHGLKMTRPSVFYKPTERGTA